MPREKLRKRRGLQIAADPLPAGGDTGRHSPKKSTPVSSPYEKGKSPHKLAMKGPVLPKETSGGRYRGTGRPTNSPELPKETSGKRLAKATNKLSLPHLDKKIKNKKYLDNDEKLRRKYGWA